MKKFTYNDMDFTVEKAKSSWEITYLKADGSPAVVGTGLFPGASDSEAEGKAETLVKSIFPVGVKVIGPDTSHPTMIGDLKIVMPDVTHPNFVYWDKKSPSFPKNLG